jgi:DNA helicase-2/ATP-dependent DNA helicase PcrA
LDLLAGLNDAQLEAVCAPDGPVLVLAGPGSGKTRVLTRRIAWLMSERGVDAYHILSVTFTNKAAREMSARLENSVGAYRQRLTMGTFHSVCVRILRREARYLGLDDRFVIYDADDSERLVTQALKELDIDTKQNRPSAVHAAISRAKNDLIRVEDYHPTLYWEEAVARVYPRYEELLTANNAFDFDDLLIKTEELLRTHAEVRERYQRRYWHVLVDEFQDTNRAQYELLRHLVPESQGSLYCVGDEDQSIYSWRGADYRNVLRFQQDYRHARVYLLEQNYRSTATILDAARHVIDRNQQRHKKDLWTENPQGEPVHLIEAYDEREEAEYVVRQARRLAVDGVCPLREMAIMYRTNAQTRALEDALMARGMRYQLVGSLRFYQRREIKDVVAYLRVILNPDDEISLLRIINVPSRLIGERTVDQLRQWAGQRRLSLGRALLRLAELDTAERAGRAAPGSVGLRRLTAFGALLARAQALLSQVNLSGLLSWLLDASGYVESLRDNTEEGEDRINNVRELLTAVQRYDEVPVLEALSAFLQEVALVSDIDELQDGADAITLLTLHGAKGLEYDVVFMVGMEDGLCPHARSRDEPDGLEEERRLCYVGMTRARKALYLLYTFRRSLYGSAEVREPSPFLADIPQELLEANTQRPLPRPGAPVAHTGSMPLGTPQGLGASSSRRALFEQRRERVSRAREQERERLEPRAERRHAVAAGRPMGERPGRTGNPDAVGAADGTPPPKLEQTLHEGDKVRHPLFGPGVVVASRLVGGDEEVTVAFVGQGIKKLMLQFARLERI